MKYLKIKEDIRQIINRKLMLENNDDLRLPSEESLAKQLNTSRVTVRESLRDLEKEGTIIRKHGVGTFINSDNDYFDRGIEKLSSVTNIIEERGFTPNTDELKINHISYEEINDEFKLRNQKDLKNKKFIKIERVRLADEIPVIFNIDYILSEKLNQKKIMNKKNFNGSLLDTLDKNHNIYITNSKAKIKPLVSDRFLQEKLKLPKNSLLLLMKQYNYNSNGDFIFFSKSYFSHDKFEVRMLRTR